MFEVVECPVLYSQRLSRPAYGTNRQMSPRGIASEHLHRSADLFNQHLRVESQMSVLPVGLWGDPSAGTQTLEKVA